jgi:hypothetical protein
MPWTPENGPARHDKKVKTPKDKRRWADVANSVLESTGDEGRAVREANGVIMKQDIAKYTGKASEASNKRPKRRVINRYA